MKTCSKCNVYLADIEVKACGYGKLFCVVCIPSDHNNYLQQDSSCKNSTAQQLPQSVSN